MTLIGQDAKTGEFTTVALQQQTREVLAGKKKIVVRYPKKKS